MTQITNMVTQTIALSHLIRDQKFQVRRKLDQPTVNRYVDVLKAGGSMPPIQVVFINDAPVLIDGWHRVAAMDQLGRPEVEAVVLEATEKEAYWLAAKANMEHGLPLKSGEQREVFRAYIKAGQHKRGRGRYKSYRDIGNELIKPHTTIRTWMIKDFPRIAALLGGNEEFKGEGGLRSNSNLADMRDGALQRLDEAFHAFQSTVDPHIRGGIVGRMDELLADMKQAGNYTLPPPPDF